MKTLLINICLRQDGRYIPPVGLGYIATSLSRSSVPFDILDLDQLRPKTDDELRDLICESTYDIYMMGCIVTGYRHVKKIAKFIRAHNPKALIVVGNSVASSIPDLLLTKTEADVAVFSEGDFTALEIIEAWKKKISLNHVDGIAYVENGSVCRTTAREVVKHIDELPFIDRDLFDIDFYIGKSKELCNEPCPIPYEDRVSMYIPSARGCPYRCSFCYFVFISDKYRFRSPNNIVAEIRMLNEKYGVNYINFGDELTFPTTKHAEGVADALIKADLGVYWNATVRGDLIKRPEHKRIVEKMKDSGCVGLTYSLEHVNSQILKTMNKRLDIPTYLFQKNALDELEMSTWTNLVIGYPEETVDTIDEAMNFCSENTMYPSTGFLLPLPDTPMYNYAMENNYIVDEEDWMLRLDDRQDLHINMTTMSDECLVNTTEAGLKRINEKLGFGLGKKQLFKTRQKRAFESNAESELDPGGQPAWYQIT